MQPTKSFLNNKNTQHAKHLPILQPSFFNLLVSVTLDVTVCNCAVADGSISVEGALQVINETILYIFYNFNIPQGQLDLDSINNNEALYHSYM